MDWLYAHFWQSGCEKDFIQNLWPIYFLLGPIDFRLGPIKLGLGGLQNPFTHICKWNTARWQYMFHIFLNWHLMKTQTPTTTDDNRHQWRLTPTTPMMMTTTTTTTLLLLLLLLLMMMMIIDERVELSQQLNTELLWIEMTLVCLRFSYRCLLSLNVWMSWILPTLLSLSVVLLSFDVLKIAFPGTLKKCLEHLSLGHTFLVGTQFLQRVCVPGHTFWNS